MPEHYSIWFYSKLLFAKLGKIIVRFNYDTVILLNLSLKM